MLILSAIAPLLAILATLAILASAETAPRICVTISPEIAGLRLARLDPPLAARWFAWGCSLAGHSDTAPKSAACTASKPRAMLVYARLRMC